MHCPKRAYNECKIFTKASIRLNIVAFYRTDLGYTIYNNQTNGSWKFRGRGLLQLTGRANYAAFTQYFDSHFNSNLDFTQNPDLIASSTDLSVISALWYFKNRVMDKLDSAINQNTTVAEITKKVTGNEYRGLTLRKNFMAQVQEYITDCLN